LRATWPFGYNRESQSLGIADDRVDLR
jgi:hypothetical protein